jgi:hypothetical protein
MKIRIISGLFLVFSSMAFADLKVSTNPHHIKSNGIYEGKVDRVIYYGPQEVGVFIKNSDGLSVGVMFSGNDSCIGSAVASCIGCDVNLAKQKDGKFTFAVNQGASPQNNSTVAEDSTKKH